MRILIAIFSLALHIKIANAASLLEITPKILPIQTLIDINDQKIDISKLDTNVLVIHFWATWCPSCTNEMIELNRLQQSLKKDKIIIIPISEDFKGNNTVKKFYETQSITHLISFIDKNRKILNQLGITNLPTTLIVNTYGQVVAVANGEVDWVDKKNIDLIKKHTSNKIQENEDYINLFNSQKNSHNQKNDVSITPHIDNLIPKSAQTELEIHKDSNLEIGEIRGTNIKVGKNSLKIRRPLHR